MSETSSKGLIGAIIFAAVVVSGSFVFFGMQFFGGSKFSDEEFQKKISEGIDKYITDQQAEYDKQAAERDKPKVVTGDFSDDDAVLGDKDAKVTIVEFSDYQCPYCKSFFDGALVDIKKKYIDTGKVKLVYRDFPLSFHPNAYPAALLAECARDQSNDEVYFKIHDKIFTEMGGDFQIDTIKDYAVTLGVKKPALEECIKSDKFKEEIDKDQADGQSVGIDGTPGFIINNKVVSGARPFSYFETIIEEELKAAK